jgi:hypothetical protein
MKPCLPNVYNESRSSVSKLWIENWKDIVQNQDLSLRSGIASQ